MLWLLCEVTDIGGKRKDLASLMRCNNLVQKCLSDTRVIADISLGISDLALLDCHFYGLWKQHVGGHQFHSNEEVQVATFEWLEVQEPSVVWLVFTNNYTLFLITKPNRCTDFSILCLEWNCTCFGQFLFPSCRSSSLYTQQWYMSYRFADSLWAGSGWNSVP